MASESLHNDLATLGLYALLVLILIAAVMALSHVLGERRKGPSTDEPFESGIVHIGHPRVRLHTPYFLIAILFVIFDLEAAFIFAWAVAFREAGWAGYWEILFFIFILGLALVYLWRVGALDWGPKGLSRRRPPPLQGSSHAASGIAPPFPGAATQPESERERP